MGSENTSRPLWHEGTVDANGEHLLLTFREGAADDDLPVALLALGPKLTIMVQFLITSTSGDDQAGHILAELRQELDTYLAGEFPLEVWDQAKYSCAASPNADSRIHWHVRFDWERDPHASAKMELDQIFVLVRLWLRRRRWMSRTEQR